MIILDMNAKSTPILVPDSAFSVETGVLTLQLSLGQYPLVGKTLTAVFWPTKVETGTLAVVNGIVQLPITLGLVAAGPNEIQLNIREGLTLEQSPKMLWFISTSVLATDPAPTEVDIITALIAQANAATDYARTQLETTGDTQTARIVSEGDTQELRVTGEGNTQVLRVTGEGDTQVGRVTAEGDTQEQRVTDEGNTQVQRVQDEFPATVDELNERIDTIITTPISGEAAAQELVDARKGQPALGGKIDLIDSEFPLRRKTRYGKIAFPADFIPVDFELCRKLDGKIYHNINLDTRWRNNAIEQTIYTDIATGNNATGDGSELTPYKTPAKAFQVAAASANTNIKIIVNADLLLRQEMFLAFDTYFVFTNKNIVITTKDNKKIPFANGDSTVRQSKRIDNVDNGILSAWTLESGNVYKVTRSNTSYVIDTSYRDDFNGNILAMQKVASIVACEAAPGSYYISGSTVYVHTFDSRVPDGQMVCVFLWTLTNLMFRLYNSTLFIENFEFFTYDGVRVRGDATSHFIFNNCDFGQTGTINSLTLLLAGKTYLFNCTTHDSYLDGFNYHYTSGIDNRAMLVFEYECVGYNNGNETNGTGNNFTTTHEGISVIRVNCFGQEAQGVLCADVNGGYSLLYDCQMINSKIATDNVRCASYQFTTDSGLAPAKARLVNCSGDSAKWAVLVDEQNGTLVTLESWNEGLVRVKRDVAL